VEAKGQEEGNRPDEEEERGRRLEHIDFAEGNLGTAFFMLDGEEFVPEVFKEGPDGTTIATFIIKGKWELPLPVRDLAWSSHATPKTTTGNQDIKVKDKTTRMSQKTTANTKRKVPKKVEENTNAA
jgi:hypothetical protein